MFKKLPPELTELTISAGDHNRLLLAFSRKGQLAGKTRRSSPSPGTITGNNPNQQDRVAGDGPLLVESGMLLAYCFGHEIWQEHCYKQHSIFVYMLASAPDA